MKSVRELPPHGSRRAFLIVPPRAALVRPLLVALVVLGFGIVYLPRAAKGVALVPIVAVLLLRWVVAVDPERGLLATGLALGRFPITSKPEAIADRSVRVSSERLAAGREEWRVELVGKEGEPRLLLETAEGAEAKRFAEELGLPIAGK